MGKQIVKDCYGIFISGTIGLLREKKLRGTEGTNYTLIEHPVTIEVTKNLGQ